MLRPLYLNTYLLTALGFLKAETHILVEIRTFTFGEGRVRPFLYDGRTDIAGLHSNYRCAYI